MPDSPIRIIKHIAEFILRSVENGRIVIWILSAWFFYKLVTKKLQLNTELKFLLVTFLLIFGLFVLFIFISQMPFSARYFMPHFFLLTILVSWYITHYIKRPKVLFAIIIFAHITGNLWVYPDEIAKSWDTTLAHIGYYKAREECFNYIDKNNYNYSDISAGFCLYGNRRYIELIDEDKVVGSDTSSRYFLYSNISNLEDDFAEEFKDKTKWSLIKNFKHGFVEISMFEKK
ncbi:hypothetical protein MASR2M117_06970 [Paludibacter sp.]